MVFVNFKTYKESTGKNALLLAHEIKKVSTFVGVKIIPVVQPSDVFEIKAGFDIEVWVQKIDPVSFGAHTGAILPEAVKDDGATGVFLNHSESRFKDYEELEAAVRRAGEVGLKTLVFAKDIDELNKISKLPCSFIAYEPPELIGSKTVSVASAKPAIIKKAVSLLKPARIPLVVGAGVSSASDVKKSLELGAIGVAVSSAIILAQDPQKKLKELAEGFKR